MIGQDEQKDSYRIFQLSKILNVSSTTIINFLNNNGFKIKNNPNIKLSKQQKNIVLEKFKDDAKNDFTIENTIFNNQTLNFEEEKEEKSDLIFYKQESKNKEKILKSFTNSENTIINELQNKISENNEERKEYLDTEEDENNEKKIKVLGQIDLNNDKFNKQKKSDSLKKQQEIKIGLGNPFVKEKQFLDEQNFKKNTEDKKKIEQKNIFSQNKQFNKKDKEKVKGFCRKTNTDFPLKTTEEIKKTRNEYAKIKKEKIELRLQDIKNKNDEVLHVSEFVTVNVLAGLLNEKIGTVLKKCLDIGLKVTINQKLDKDTILIIADEFGKKVSFEEIKVYNEVINNEDNRELKKRNPVITIMGHVDHGKTSLLDYIRRSNVVKTEKGGITQHIGAYKIKIKSGEEIVFVDTPGHEAFTAMRSRGCDVTDIIVIVIAADDGVMPQTVEALNQAKLSEKPIIFAINKIDKEGANQEKIKEDLAKLNFLVEDWGGKYQCQGISAKTGQGVDVLLEKIILEAEMMNLQAHFEGVASGVVLESSLEKGRGFINNLLVQDGELKVGDVILAGSFYGKIKSIVNDAGSIIKQAYPSDPVKVIGLNGAAKAGERFFVINDEKKAKIISEEKTRILREQNIQAQNRITLKDLNERVKNGNYNEINVIIRGDVDGSIQALADSLFKLSSENIVINIISNNVSEISDSDVELAVATKAIIIGFNKKASKTTQNLAAEKKIEIKYFSIIYEVIDYISEKIKNFDDKKQKEIYVGKAKVIALFKVSKVGTIAGCLVLEGPIHVNDTIKIIRNNVNIFEGKCVSLRHLKNDALEIKAGIECGVNIKGYGDYKIDDILEFYKKE